jgi:hypothetical protein
MASALLCAPVRRKWDEPPTASRHLASGNILRLIVSCERITPRRRKDRRTYVLPGTRHESRVGIREARKAHARLVSGIRARKYGGKVTPDKIRTLAQLPMNG